MRKAIRRMKMRRAASFNAPEKRTAKENHLALAYLSGVIMATCSPMKMFAGPTVFMGLPYRRDTE
jgi:hypothetical protein